MSYLDTPYKKKSAVLTSIIMGLMLYLIFNFGMKYFDPPEEYGIAVNFGTSDVGSGDIESEPSSASASTPEEVVEEVEEVVQEPAEEVEPTQEATPEPTAPTPTKAEDVATQDNAETIRINKQKEAQRKVNEAKRKVKEAERQAKLKAERVKKQKKAAEAKKRAAEAKKKKEQSDKKKRLDNLMGGLNNGGNGKGKGGQGDDNKPGNKGNPNGDPNASGYYGNGGGGSGGNYRLGNRKAVAKPKPTYDCNEQGKVVVSISVNKSGRVISARAGVKGTTNSALCLLKRAKEAALKTKFNSDSKAPTKQVGSIIYNFSLSN